MPSRPVLVLSGWVCVLEEGGDVASLCSALTSLVIRLLFFPPLLRHDCLSKYTLQQDQEQTTVEFLKIVLHQAPKLHWVCSGVLGSAWFSRSSPCWQMIVKGRCYVIAYCLDQRQL